MIPWQQVDSALGGHWAKFVSLGLLHPVSRGGAAFVDEAEWSAFLSRVGRADSGRLPDWGEPPAAQPGGNVIMEALRRMGARFRS